MPCTGAFLACPGAKLACMAVPFMDSVCGCDALIYRCDAGIYGCYADIYGGVQASFHSVVLNTKKTQFDQVSYPPALSLAACTAESNTVQTRSPYKIAFGGPGGWICDARGNDVQAKAYVLFLSEQIKEVKAFEYVQLAPTHYWARLIFMDRYNYAGLEVC
eukprot:2339903-Rhodomonas_salina.1